MVEVGAGEEFRLAEEADDVVKVPVEEEEEDDTEVSLADGASSRIGFALTFHMSAPVRMTVFLLLKGLTPCSSNSTGNVLDIDLLFDD